MNYIRQRCRELGLTLPSVSPRGLYSTVERDGQTLYVSGQVSRLGDEVIPGPVDALSENDATKAASVAALRALAVLADAIQPEEKLRVLRLVVYVMSTPAFKDHSKVADGASQVLRDVLGEDGIHCRTAIGVASLPGGGAVELDLTCAVSKIG